jgi:hypothetical protein
MKPNLWEYILALILAYPAVSGACGVVLLAIAGIRLPYRKYIFEELKKSNAELQKLEAEKAQFGAEYVDYYDEERLKNFHRDYNNWWWNLKNLSITIGLGLVGLALITVAFVNDIVIKGNTEHIWSLLSGLLAWLVAYLVMKEAVRKFSQLEKFFTKMKNDIGELKEQNTKLSEAISDLNHRLEQRERR